MYLYPDRFLFVSLVVAAVGLVLQLPLIEVTLRHQGVPEQPAPQGPDSYHDNSTKLVLKLAKIKRNKGEEKEGKVWGEQVEEEEKEEKIAASTYLVSRISCVHRGSTRRQSTGSIKVSPSLIYDALETGNVHLEGTSIWKYLVVMFHIKF